MRQRCDPGRRGRTDCGVIRPATWWTCPIRRRCSSATGSAPQDRWTLLRPRVGKRLRLINLTVYQPTSDNPHFCEVYFGTGATIASNPRKAIGYVRVPDHSSGSTRTWGRGAGPAGGRNEPLSVRWITRPTTSHKFIVEYTEER